MFYRVMVVGLFSFLVSLPVCLVAEQVPAEFRPAQVTECFALLKSVGAAALIYGDACRNVPKIVCKKCSKNLSFFGYMFALGIDSLDNDISTVSKFNSSKATLIDLESVLLQKNPDALAALIMRSLKGDKKVINLFCSACAEKGVKCSNWQLKTAKTRRKK